MPSPMPRARSSVPSDTHSDLKIDLSQLQPAKKSCSSASTPRQQTVSREHTADFTELLRQLKEKERSHSGSDNGAEDNNIKEKYNDDDDVDRTSPKSAPNTDEGFGTFTKTTPRGKDSSSEGSDDHTDCDVDHLMNEPGSITEWWDRIEMPTEVTSLETVFKQAEQHRQTQISRIEEDGSIELADDELMCMIDNIGMNGIKASSGLASAQETELRLLNILKERDDLVLSYHTALKELSKLTARIKDENHLLRQQLNMEDLSHSEIVLALEQQASDGRHLALSLQDDLTDTELNVVARLREDKHVLQDRLAALEYQYNSDLAKWRTELAVYKSKVDDDGEGEVTRENHMLKLQLDEMRNMFDVTVSQTQEECNNYLTTIDKLKHEISCSKSPLSDSQLEALAVRQADMERLYESMISSLEGDNSQLQASLEELQEELDKLRLEKAKADKSCGTMSHLTDSGMGTETASLVRKSMNTSNSLSNKATETSDVKMCVKSVATDEDPQLGDLQRQVARLETVLSQSDLDKETLQQQKSGLMANHKQLSERLNNLESQLQISQHKLTTLQAVHELVLSKNESMERSLEEAHQRSLTESRNNEKLKQQLNSELDKARSDSMNLSADVMALRQQVTSLQSENAGYRQREVDMNSELTKLTLERSNLQGKVNTLNADLVQQKAQYMSQSLRLQQLEATKSKLENETSEFKHDSLDLYKQLEKARQEKDELSNELSSLHSRLRESVDSWQRKLDSQNSTHNQARAQLEADIRSQQSSADLHRAESEQLNSQVTELTKQLRDARETSEWTKKQLDDVLRTAKLDKSSENVIEELNDKLKSLQQQNAEYRFTTTHFRSENSQLQLKVNQLEELNKGIEQRNSILQKELATVQASLDDSYSSQDAQLNLLDLSSSDLMAMSDTSELRKLIMAAKQQLEMMQNKRAKSNIEYSRKIGEMEGLLKGRSASTTDTSSSVTTESRVPQSVHSSDQLSSGTTEFIRLPDKVDMNSSISSVSRLDDTHTYRQDRNSLPQAASKFSPNDRLSTAQHCLRSSNGPSSLSVPYTQSSSSTSDYNMRSSRLNGDLDEQLEFPDSLSLKVQSLTNKPGTSTPTLLSPRSNGHLGHSPARKVIYTSSDSSSGAEIRTPSANQNKTGVQLSDIESENAALRAELEMINSDRQSLHKHMHQQVGQHDLLNETLDELERSLEEVCDSNRLLRDTLGDCNQYIQTNLLSEPNTTHLYNGRSRNMTPNVRPHSVTPHVRPHSVTPSYRPHSVTPSYRPHSVTPMTRTQPSRPHSVAAGAMYRSAPMNVSFGNDEVRTYDSGAGAGWSAQSDQQLTSSADFNKLQQTNVHNYESLLMSDTNSKSPTKRSLPTSATKSQDLNHMIQHSLSRLNQVNSSSLAGSPYTADSGAFSTSTPVRSSRVGQSSRYNNSTYAGDYI